MCVEVLQVICSTVYCPAFTAGVPSCINDLPQLGTFDAFSVCV